MAGDAREKHAGAQPKGVPDRPFFDLVDAFGAVVWEADIESRRTTFISEKAEAILGHSIDAWLIDDEMRERLLHPADVAHVEEHLEKALTSGADVTVEYRVITASGSVAWLRDLIRVERDRAGISRRLHGVTVDVTASKKIELRQAAQQAIVRVMAEATTLTEVAPGLLEAICDNLEWHVGCMYELDTASNRLRFVADWFSPRVSMDRFAQMSRTLNFAPGLGLPGRVWQTRAPHWIENVGDDPNFPRAAVAEDAGLHGGVGFPILGAGDEFLGVLEFFSHEMREPDQDLIRYMAMLAFQVGQFIQRKRAEASLRKSIERTEFLAEAGSILSRSLDFPTTLASLTRLVVPRLADWCAVDVLMDDGEIHRLASAHIDSTKAALTREADERYGTPSHTGHGARRAIKTGNSELHTSVSDGFVNDIAEDEYHLRILRSLGFESVMCLPLIARGRTLGSITLVAAESTRRYTAVELALAEDLANRAAMAIDNARLYRERSSVAQTLQQSLLPPSLPLIPRVELAARYRPAGEGNEVGGDFYDVFRTGRDDWAIVIGDVCGKGADAAAMTALARYTLRAAAMQAKKPTRVLSTLNEALLIHDTDRKFCTVIYVRLRTVDNHVRVTIACGGHPPPVVIHADGKVTTAGVPGMLLGLFPDPDLTDTTVDLAPGDALVLFTDGVTEARSGDDFFGEERLMTMLEDFADRDAVAIADGIERAVLAFQTGKPRDDTAILVVRALA
ncbi:MAG: SpoIIE family protein phosphatase [Actinobacteria bacterium]|nr:SpoIIE family protein phosphatase [Actinomycetota bacterium]